MKESEIRGILESVIEDIDQGRIRLQRPRPWRRALGSAVVAATLGLGAGACGGHNIGVAGDGGVDASSRSDATSDIDGGGQLLYQAPMVDAGPMPEYGEPFLDAGNMPAYAEPWLDAGSSEDYAAPPVDGGNDTLYSAPVVDASVEPDSEIAPAYGVPFRAPYPDEDPALEREPRPDWDPEARADVHGDPSEPEPEPW